MATGQNPSIQDFMTLKCPKFILVEDKASGQSDIQDILTTFEAAINDLSEAP